MHQRPLLFWTVLVAVLTAYVAPAQEYTDPSRYDVSWESPGASSFDSMPLGNGDIGMNVWTEPGGAILFYISKVDAFDAGHLLPKIGRIRITTDPPLDFTSFKQTLHLHDASVSIEAGDAHFTVWVDANHPVIQVDGRSRTPRRLNVALETLRPLQSAAVPLPSTGTAGVLFDDRADRIAWCYRNQSSAWAVNARNQNSPAMIAQTKDPLLSRTSGAVVQAQGCVRTSPTALRSKAPSTSFSCTVRVLSSQPPDVQAWLRSVTRLAAPDRTSHLRYWKTFWERSYIHVASPRGGMFDLDQCRYAQVAQGARAYADRRMIDAGQNASQISQRYALERFCEAAASRGAVPPPYNGSIFTMDMPAGVLGFDEPKTAPVSADERDWAILSFMWQNTRHPYWSMAARGDYDAMRPGLAFVRQGLDICRDHCKTIFGHDGAFIMEASWWYNVGVFNWPDVPAHLRYHQLATVELPAIMCEYYEHTRDRGFLDSILLPCADEFLKFYAMHFPKRDARGIMQMEGVGCVETYQGVTNPCTEIGAMKFVLTKLLSFDIDGTRRARWQSMLEAMPGLPLRRVRGLDLLAVGEKYNPGRVLCESPDLYSVYPFRQAWLGRPAALAIARQSLHLRTTSIDGSVDDQATETGGWQAAPVQAAYLGLAREAARVTSINFNDRFIHWNDNIDPASPPPDRPRARFPGFWECKMDGTPDNDHGANSASALQSMLLQSDGKAIYLLPAWPEEWDVAFKLHAANNTIVECEYRDGAVRKLKVTPSARRADIIDGSSLRQRIRTLVATALADHNYLFGLPPMLDAQPHPGPTTTPWVTAYGKTLEGCLAGPWPNSVFTGNTAYVHMLDWPEGGVRLSSIPRRLVASASVTGKISVVQDGSGWLLIGTPDSLDTIIRLDFDGPLEGIARALPSVGSLTQGRTSGVAVDSAGHKVIEVHVDPQQTVRRFEITIDNPGHRRGASTPYAIQAHQPDGSWRKVHEGKIYGTICGKACEPFTADRVRLDVGGATVTQFDLFPDVPVAAAP